MSTSARPTGTVPAGGQPRPLDLLTEQLWAPAIETGDVRTLVDPEASPDWEDAEAYRVVPSVARARLLLPAAHRAVTAAALTNYRGLRLTGTNLPRAALGSAIRLGAPVARHKFVVQRRRALDSTRPDLPLEMLARALGHDELFASIGVRTGANRKATLQLVDTSGAPAGFAKFSWNAPSAALVQTERDALSQVGCGSGPARAPQLLAHGDFYGNPYLVSAPLSLGSRAVRADEPAPNPLEIATLCPVVGHSSIAETQQFRALRDRVTGLALTPASKQTLEASGVLLSMVAERGRAVPTTSRWHGDLTPWNAARDENGTLWCWDWESSESDVVAGMDSLHWAISVRRMVGQTVDGDALRAAFDDAALHLTATGLARSSWGDLAGVYAVTTAERACALAAEAGGWERLWIQPSQLEDLLHTAKAMLTAHPS